MSKKLKKKVRRILVLFIGIIVIIGIFVVFNKSLSKKPIETIKKITKPKIVEVWPKVYEINMVATGDGLLHNSVYNDAKGRNGKTYDFSHQLSLVKDIISSYDIAYYNQETLFGGPQPGFKDEGYGSYPHFNSPSEFGDAMVDTGFNLVSLASNHSADCKATNESCLTNSYNYWSSKNIVFDGFNDDEAKENKYNTGEKNNITYGFLNYTDTLNGLDSTVRNIRYLIDTMDFADGSIDSCPENYSYSTDIGKCVSNNVTNEITELRSKVDVLIVAMHWHYSSAEYQQKPTQMNENIAKYLNSLGVDIILGTYSHCIQPFDIIGEEHKTLVFYSLGNFISNQVPQFMGSVGNKGQIGVLANFKITKTLEKDGTSKIEIGDLGADLLYTYRSPKAEFKVVPFSRMTSDYCSDEEAKKIYENYSSVLTSLNENITIKELSSDIN